MSLAVVMRGSEFTGTTREAHANGDRRQRALEERFNYLGDAGMRNPCPPGNRVEHLGNVDRRHRRGPFSKDREHPFHRRLATNDGDQGIGIE